MADETLRKVAKAIYEKEALSVSENATTGLTHNLVLPRLCVKGGLRYGESAKVGDNGSLICLTTVLACRFFISRVTTALTTQDKN